MLYDTVSKFCRENIERSNGHCPRGILNLNGVLMKNPTTVGTCAGRKRRIDAMWSSFNSISSFFSNLILKYLKKDLLILLH